MLRRVSHISFPRWRQTHGIAHFDAQQFGAKYRFTRFQAVYCRAGSAWVLQHNFYRPLSKLALGSPHTQMLVLRRV